MPNLHNSKEQGSADLLYYYLFFKMLQNVEPIMSFAAFTLFSTRALGEIGVGEINPSSSSLFYI